MAGSEIKVMWERILNYTITEQKTSNIHEFLKAHGYSSSLIRAIKEDTEGIRLNGDPVLARTLLTPGDQLAIRITETKFSENIVPSDLPLSIVYEDPDLLVINKPAGMPIHPSQGNYDNTLANACAWYFKEKGEPFVYRCINRLDRDTTGLLIIARHLYSASLLSAMMARREIHREYLALATGIIPEYEPSLLQLPEKRVLPSSAWSILNMVNMPAPITAGFPLQIQIRSTLWLP